MSKWPRLSETLPECDELFQCRACGLVAPVVEQIVDAGSVGESVNPQPKLHRWQEHNDDDKPDPIVVVLCQACSDKIIEPHPRLYRRMDRWEPFAGAVGICRDCPLRKGSRCTSPQAKLNGGPGVELIYPRPSTAHVLRRGKGQRSGFETIYHGPVRACSAKPAGELT